MALDPTARETNYRDSIKKFFVDNIKVTSGIALLFDPNLATPRLIGHHNQNIDRWVAVNFGTLALGYMSEGILSVHCCTRKDNEGFRLAQLRDTVVGYLTDSTATDGMKRIPFYRSYADQAWTLLGALLVQSIDESQQLKTEDDTKYKILTVRLRFASKV